MTGKIPVPRSFRPALVWAVTLVTAGLSHVATPGMATFLDITAIGAILLLGLPHGALDLIELRTDTDITCRPATILIAYCVLLAAAALLWWADARLALSSFLILSIGHFAGEWRENLPAPVAMPAAALVVALPAAAWPHEVGGLFGALCHDDAMAERLVSLAGASALPLVLLLAVALMVTPIRRSEGSILLGLGLAGLVLLPVQAFAVFFALVHSPRHLSSFADRHGWPVLQTYRRAMPLTVAATAILALLLSAKWPSPAAPPFLLLAILAVPHMFSAPALRVISKLGNRRFRQAVPFDRHRTRSKLLP